MDNNKNLPTAIQLKEIAQNISELFKPYDISLPTLVFELSPDEKKKIDEDCFYRSVKDDNTRQFDPGEVVIIKSDGITMKFL